VILFNLSNLPWVDGRLKRNQAIFSYLLKSSRRLTSGVYVETPGFDRHSIADLLQPPRLSSIYSAENDGKHITAVRPMHTYPLRYRSVVRNLAARYIGALLDREYIRGCPYVLWMNSPDPLSVNLAHVMAARAALRVFDASDDFSTFDSSNAKQLDYLTALADVVVCVNEHVCSKLSHRRKMVFRNCTDFDTFQRADPHFTLQPFFPKPANAIYIGFTGGANSNRIDRALLEHLFRRFPTYQFLFIGYSNDAALVEWIRSAPNAAFIPEVPYNNLPFIVRSFDVAIVPHIDNEHTRGNDLLKILDYMACGVPVVTTPTSNVERYGAAVYVAKEPDGFADHIESLVSGKLSHDPTLGLAIARERSWQLRVPELASGLEL
jgi:glycosyltransferase involved in cell wall biosynthesis